MDDLVFPLHPRQTRIESLHCMGRVHLKSVVLRPKTYLEPFFFFFLTKYQRSFLNTWTGSIPQQAPDCERWKVLTRDHSCISSISLAYLLTAPPCMGRGARSVWQMARTVYWATSQCVSMRILLFILLSSWVKSVMVSISGQCNRMACVSLKLQHVA